MLWGKKASNKAYPRSYLPFRTWDMLMNNTTSHVKQVTLSLLKAQDFILSYKYLPKIRSIKVTVFK